MSNPLQPSPALLAKLGSIIVHFDEYESDNGHEFDFGAAVNLLVDPEVENWLSEMTKMAMIPARR